MQKEKGQGPEEDINVFCQRTAAQITQSLIGVARILLSLSPLSMRFAYTTSYEVWSLYTRPARGEINFLEIQYAQTEEEEPPHVLTQQFTCRDTLVLEEFSSKLVQMIPGHQ